MSIRRAASCSQPRQDSSLPRGARTGRAPGIEVAPVLVGMAEGYPARPAMISSPNRARPLAVTETMKSWSSR